MRSAPARAARRRLLDAFVEMGSDTLDFLIHSIEHENWFVVRNVVYLMGKLGLPECLDAAEKVLGHSDIRVRREALRTIAATKCERAVEILRRRFDDPEPAIRGLAAEWLAIIGPDSVADEYRALLNKQSKMLWGCPELAIAVIRAMGRIGDGRDIQIIETYKKKPMWLLSLNRKSPMADTCGEAIAEIKRRERNADAEQE